MRNIILTVGWIIAVIFCILFFIKKSDANRAEDKADTLRNVISVDLPKIVAKSKAIVDSSAKHDQQYKLNAWTAKKSDSTSNLLTKIDTVNINLHKLLLANKKDYEAVIKSKSDSIRELKDRSAGLINMVATLKKGIQNVGFNDYTPAMAFVIDSLNASIYVRPFKKSSRQSIFSPQRNYLRVFNQVNNGTVNGRSYFDYEQTNDEINQVLFQARASYNLQNDVLQFGAGVELKLNRTGINGALLFNPFAGRKPTLTLGIRQDVYRIKFR